MVKALPAGLRQRISDRAIQAVSRADKGLTDRLLAEAFYWRHQLPLVARRMRAGKRPDLFSGRRALIAHRLDAFETRLLGADAAQAAELRDELFLQIDLQALQRRSGDAGRALDSKSGFSDACVRHDLPHVRTYKIGTDRNLPQGAALPLFLKPERANRARGCAVIEAAPEGAFSLVERSGTKAGTLAQLLAGHCPGEALVAQNVLANDPAVEALVGPVVLTLRLVTGITEGKARLLSALAEIPLDDIRPLSKKWAMLPVDCESGIMAKADPQLPHCPDPHPLTGERISGQRVPEWAAARACGEQAHVLIAPDVPMVGWDVAITREGAVLIEGNVNWAVATHCRNAAGFDLGPARRFARFAAGGAV